MTVYRMLSKPKDWYDIERMALHEGLDDQELGQGPKFPFRVVFRFTDTTIWQKSCRSAGDDFEGGSSIVGCTDPFASPEERAAANLEAALKWLKEGESEPG